MRGLPFGSRLQAFLGYLCGDHDLTAGDHKLTVEIMGANDKAIKNYMFGLDYVKLDPL